LHVTLRLSATLAPLRLPGVRPLPVGKVMGTVTQLPVMRVGVMVADTVPVSPPPEKLAIPDKEQPFKTKKFLQASPSRCLKPSFEGQSQKSEGNPQSCNDAMVVEGVAEGMNRAWMPVRSSEHVEMQSSSKW